MFARRAVSECIIVAIDPSAAAAKLSAKDFSDWLKLTTENLGVPIHFVERSENQNDP